MAKERRTRTQTKKTAATKKARSSPKANNSSKTARPSGVDAKRTSYLEAVKLYEKGLEALQQRNFTGASSALKSVIDEHGDERELHERARIYLKICERELAPLPAAPQTEEELVLAATVALNEQETEKALGYLEQAVRENPSADGVHYMLAVLFSQQGNPEQALTHLGRAIELDPENRLVALQEVDFDILKDEIEFQTLVAEPPPSNPKQRRSVF
jgi:tetratricopeptide (TPR) repeat protein